MAKAKKVKQFSFALPNRVGLLAEVTTALVKGKVNVSAICAYEMENQGYFMLTADSPAKAKKALAGLEGEIREDDIVAVELPNKVGELQKVAQKLAESGINIDFVYGTTAAGKTSICLFKTADDSGAIKLINKK